MDNAADFTVWNWSNYLTPLRDNLPIAGSSPARGTIPMVNMTIANRDYTADLGQSKAGLILAKLLNEAVVNGRSKSARYASASIKQLCQELNLIAESSFDIPLKSKLMLLLFGYFKQGVMSSVKLSDKERQYTIQVGTTEYRKRVRKIQGVTSKYDITS